MKAIVIAAGAAAMLLTAGAADAATKHHKKPHHSGMSGPAVAGPSQPIPYAMLDDYMRASPKQRSTKDWWSGSAMASTGASTNAAATTSDTGAAPAAGAVNPPTRSAPAGATTGGANPQ